MFTDRRILPGAVIVILLSVPFWIGSVWRWLSDTTTYSPGYTEQKMLSLRLGMSEREVIRIMGIPLKDVSDPGRVSWYYGPSTLKIARNGATSGPEYTYVLADANGNIESMAGDYLKARWQDLIGINLEEMRRRYGEPIAILPHDKWRYLAYSESKVDGSYYIRRVWLNRVGQVARIEMTWYQD
jgi:hypothetical protein